MTMSKHPRAEDASGRNAAPGKTDRKDRRRIYVTHPRYPSTRVTWAGMGRHFLWPRSPCGRVRMGEESSGSFENRRRPGEKEGARGCPTAHTSAIALHQC